MTEASPQRRPRTGRRLLIVLLALALLAGVLVGLDRLAVQVAENALASRAQAELATRERPDVSIGGFPFLPQVVFGDLNQVSGTAYDATVRVNDSDVHLARVEATARDLTTEDWYRTVTAGQVDAAVTMDYASLGALAGVSLDYAGNGKVRLAFEVPIGRLTVRGTAIGTPTLDVDAQTLTIADAELSMASPGVPQAVVDAVGRIVLAPLPLDQLPYGLRMTGLTTGEDGVEVAVEGDDVPLRWR